MKRLWMICISCAVLSSCGRDSGREQKITIKVEAPPESQKSGSPSGEGAAAAEVRNVPDLLRDLLVRLDDIKPIIRKLTEDQECRRLIGAADARQLAKYLSEKHADSIDQVAAIIGAKDREAVALTVSRHMIRKSEMPGPARPVMQKRAINPE